MIVNLEVRVILIFFIIEILVKLLIIKYRLGQEVDRMFCYLNDRCTF